MNAALEKWVEKYRPALTAIKSGEPKVAMFEGRLVGLLALAALVTRFLSVPWDSGGCFLQCWMSMVGTAGLAALLPRLKTPQRMLACGLLIPCLAFCFFGPIFFSAGTVFPFFFTGVVIGGGLLLWSHSITLPAVLAAFLLIPFGGCCGGALKHMSLVNQFRGLQGASLQEIRFEPMEQSVPSVVIRESKDLARIVATFRSTTPYSPNHEGMRNPWRMTLVLKDGSSIDCRVGKGNRAHPKTAWVQLGEEAYQNPGLPKALVEATGLPNFSQMNP